MVEILCIYDVANNMGRFNAWLRGTTIKQRGITLNWGLSEYHQAKKMIEKPQITYSVKFYPICYKGGC